MRTLLLDIETAPNQVWAWGLFDQNININQIIEPARMLCFSAKWLDEKPIMFFSEWDDGHTGMVRAAHELLDEADAVVHYNGKRFDIPHLNREFLLEGFVPPSPYAQIDLYQTVKSRFRFASGKLDHVAQELGLGGKIHHEGVDLWLKTMAGDPKAQKRMERYNRQDTKLLQGLYEMLLPWIVGHPNRRLYDGGACPVCAADVSHLKRRGFATTRGGRYRQYQCDVCGSWARDSRREAGSPVQASVL